MKCIAKSKLLNESSEFLRHVDALSTLDHPHIVQLHGVVVSSNHSVMLVGNTHYIIILILIILILILILILVIELMLCQPWTTHTLSSYTAWSSPAIIASCWLVINTTYHI